MHIRDVQARMLVLAGVLENPDDPMTDEEVAEELRRLVVALFRRPYVRRAPVKSKPMTPELKMRLREAARQNPDMSYQDIGVLLGVNAGRVSEAVAGKRR